MNTDQKNMFFAVALSAMVLFTWQFFFAPKITPQSNSSVVTTTSTTTESKLGKSSTVTETPKSEKTAAPIQNQKLETKTIAVENYNVTLKNDFSIVDMKSKGAVFAFKDISGAEQPFKIQAITANGARDIFFNFTQTDNGIVKGEDPNLGVKLEGNLSRDTGRFSFYLRSSQPLKYRFIFNSTPEQLDNGQARDFIYFAKEVERTSVGDDHQADASLKWFGLDFNYHLIAVIPEGKTSSKVEVLESGTFNVDTLKSSRDFKADLVFVKKNYDQLTAMGDNLDLSVDFGIFGILAVPILRGLQFFYDFIPNYGIAIIFLTLLIRMLTFPLQYKSFKSMKKMQVVQPELQKLKEKYKDDPQRMQRETMELFKRAGANPLGGCLPMLLQMPIFFAFYQVLYNAVELVQAPFAFWILDLSIKDPYYVLPVLMGIAMFGQTKLNPSTTADPTQQKVMMFMPLFFCFIMKDLPAGLNLYIFVSTVFGIAQQLFVYKTMD